jgi:4'-phosphopantetheinyl transferase
LGCFGAKPTDADQREFSHIRHSLTLRRSLRTRALLRHALSHACGNRIASEEWSFERDAFGKPSLAMIGRALHFNCSHTPWISVVAVSRHQPVGIDIERVEPACEPSLIDDYLTAGEQEAVNSLPRSAQARARARLWALKEATIKMLGMGFAYDIAQLEFDVFADSLNSGVGDAPDVRAMRIATWSVPNIEQPLCVAVAVQDRNN